MHKPYCKENRTTFSYRNGYVPLSFYVLPFVISFLFFLRLMFGACASWFCEDLLNPIPTTHVFLDLRLLHHIHLGEFLKEVQSIYYPVLAECVMSTYHHAKLFRLHSLPTTDLKP